MRKWLIGGLVVLLLLAAALYIAVRLTLGADLVRSALEVQLQQRLGQPVSIGRLSTAIFPRVALELHDLTIGEPAAVQIEDVRLVTGLRGLFDRTIADAEVLVADGRITLPLPFALADEAASAGDGAPAAFTVTSIRDITLQHITLAAGDAAVVLGLKAAVTGDRLEVHDLTAEAATTRVTGSGALTSIERMQGEFEVRADPLDLDEMMALASALTAAAPSTGGPQAQAVESPMRIILDLTAPAGTFSSYSFGDLAATLELTSGRAALAPLALGTLDGRVDGALTADTRQRVPQLTLAGRVEGLDVAQLLAAGGYAGGITGRLGGRVDLTASGAATRDLLRTARGSIEAAVTDGSIPGLDLVRPIVLAFGKPSGAPPAGSGSTFSRLGGTFTLAGGTLTSDDLAMASRDFDLTGRATFSLTSGDLSGRADVRLSRELTAQAGTDLRRFTQQEGRIVVPATISGTLEQPRVALDIADATKRAIGNELKRRTKGLLDDLLKRK